MCYSLYLVHWPITKLISHWLFELGVTTVWDTLAITIPVGVAASVCVAWVFHVLVERRFLNSPSTVVRRHHLAPELVKPVGAVVRPAFALDSTAHGR
jgi:peptidoglycan/LPS O-acetylase OafA/YrhL